MWVCGAYSPGVSVADYLVAIKGAAAIGFVEVVVHPALAARGFADLAGPLHRRRFHGGNSSGHCCPGGFDGLRVDRYVPAVIPAGLDVGKQGLQVLGAADEPATPATHYQRAKPVKFEQFAPVIIGDEAERAGEDEFGKIW